MKQLLIILLFLTPLITFSQIYSVDLSNSAPSRVKNIVISYFFDKGIGIQTIDKESGLFLSTQQNYFRRWSYSEKKKPNDDSAAVILKFKTGLQPLTVTGRIMIRVSELETGGTKLTVKLVDIEAMSDKSMDADWRYMYATSSGFIEQEIIKYIRTVAN